LIFDFVDGGANNRWVDNKSNLVSTGTHPTSGIAEEVISTVNCVQPRTKVYGYLRLNNLVGGDSFTFRVYKSYDGAVTWDIVDETNIVGAPTIARYDFAVVLEDKDEQVRVTVQRIAGLDRAFYYKIVRCTR